MSPVVLGLTLAFTAITLAEQVYLTRTAWPLALQLGSGLVYGGMTFLATGSWPAAALLAALCAAARLAAHAVDRRRGPDLWTGLALVAPPYLGAWLAWALVRPALRPGLAAVLLAVYRALALTPTLPPAALPRALVLIAAYAFCWGSATLLTRHALAGYGAQLAARPSRDPEVLLQVAATAAGDRGLARAGRLIGDLERLVILTLVLSGSFTALGFVIAAKSIARFELVRTHGEYFIVGTLCSIAIAVAVGLVARAALAP